MPRSYQHISKKEKITAELQLHDVRLIISEYINFFNNYMFHQQLRL